MTQTTKHTPKSIPEPEFKAGFFHPKFWLTWIGIILLYTISWLPYRLQILLAKGLARLLGPLLKSRRKIAARNIALCFPQMPAQEQAQLVQKNLENTVFALFETSIAWWWPNWRIRRKIHLKGFEHVEQARAEGKGILLLAAHALHLEVDGRGIGLHHESVGFYRPHDNPLMEYFQYHGRCRSNKYMIGKRNVRGLIEALNDTELCFYLPDQDYGRNRCEFVPFFAVKETATTTGTLLFAKEANCKVITLLTRRDNQGYHIEFLPPLENFPSGDNHADVTLINQWVEQAVLEAVDQYMWVHRRFKTRPDPDAPSYYK